MTLKYSRELSNLEYMKRRNQPNLDNCQIRLDLLPLLRISEFLSDIDVVAAKAKYANRNGIYQQLRKIVCISEMPTTILYLNNKQKKRNYASAKLN
jgi:DNA mismatch repair protein MutS2